MLRTLLALALPIALIAAPTSAARLDSDRAGPPGVIAYTEGNICLVNANGSDRRCLTRTGIDHGPVVWSADGRRLAFERVHDDVRGGRSEVVIIDTRGRKYGQLSPNKLMSWEPAWSPVAPRLAFTRASPDGGAIFVVNADGTGARQLMSNARNPSWSRDGRKIAFTRTQEGLFVVNADGGGVRLVRRGVYEPVAWSPDGRRLLLAQLTGDAGNRHVFVMNASGAGLRRLTTSCDEDYLAVWSPDGRKVAFSCSRRRGSYEDVYTVNVDGSDLRRLTSNPRTDSHPAWSPDSQWIAYESYRGENPAVWIMRSDGTGARRITQYTFDLTPAWAPDN